MNIPNHLEEVLRRLLNNVGIKKEIIIGEIIKGKTLGLEEVCFKGKVLKSTQLTHGLGRCIS